jgi:hypothetical protein
MCIEEFEIIRKNCTRWVLVPVGALAGLELAWILSGVYGLSALPFWIIKFGIFAYTGYVCTGDDD